MVIYLFIFVFHKTAVLAVGGSLPFLFHSSLLV